jgi:hypothetical protein
MAEIDRKQIDGRCTVCDTYNMKGTWTCECGGVNVSKLARCWKCGRERATRE